MSMEFTGKNEPGEVSLSEINIIQFYNYPQSCQ